MRSLPWAQWKYTGCRTGSSTVLKKSSTCFSDGGVDPTMSAWRGISTEVMPRSSTAAFVEWWERKQMTVLTPISFSALKPSADGCAPR